MSSLAKAVGHPEAPRVLSTAMARIMDHWGLTNAQAGRILGVSASTARRLRTGDYQLDPDRKEFELAQLLLRVYRSLNGWLGNDDRACRSWLTTRNLDLEKSPLEAMAGVRGLVVTADYLDDLRARV